MIPKIIHYCWFGNNKKPENVIQFINNWKEKLPNFKIMEWNEKNFDVMMLQELKLCMNMAECIWIQTLR